MTIGIDEVSRQIGSLTARVDEAMRQNNAIFNKMDKANEELIEQRGAVKLLSSQLVEHKINDVAKHLEFDNVVKDVEEMKNKGKGIGIGLGLLGGGGGLAGLIALFKGLTEGG